MNNLKAIFFDWSGTLYNDFDSSYISTKATIRAFGGPHLTIKKYREEFDLPVWKFYRRYVGHASIDEIDRYYFDHFTPVSQKAKLYPGVISLLKLARKQGIKLYVFSTVRQSLLEDLLKKTGIHSYFKEVIGSVRDKERTLSSLCRRLKLKPSETLFVGDMEHDVKAAQKAGVWSGAFLGGYHAPERLLKLAPDFVWNDHQGMEMFLMRRGAVSAPVRVKGGVTPPLQLPISTVGALIFHKQKIFLIQTHKWSHTFGIPGGKVESGETLVQALHREIREETGMKLHDVRYVLVQESIYSREFYKPKSHFLLFNYTAKTSSPKFKLNDEAESGFWIDIHDALKLHLNDPTRLLIRDYLKAHA